LDIEAADAAIDINNTSTDPLIHFQVSGTTNFTIGTDVTDSKFKIGTTALETGTAVTVQSTGEVGIGTTSPTSLVEISSGTSGDAVLTISADTDNDNENDNPRIELIQDGGNFGGYMQLEGDPGTTGTSTLLNALLLGSTTSAVQLVTNGVARLTVEHSGEVGIGTTSPTATLDVDGSAIFNESGNSVDFRVEGDTEANLLFVDASTDRVGIGTNAPIAPLHVSSDGVTPMVVNRDNSASGWLIGFYVDDSYIGEISYTGTTVSYNAFTGSHYGYSKDETFKRGMLVSFNDENNYLHGGLDGEILYGISYTSKPNDSKVAGSFLTISQSNDTISLDNPYQFMAVGNGDVWVTDEGGDITTGDYLISSSVAGHAMKDNGDYEVSHIFSKATESVNWSTVQPDSNGVKRKKIIVYFESFDKPNYEKKFREQQAIIESLKTENETIKAEASSSSVETNQKLKETAQKLAALEAKLNALLLLNSKGAVLTAEN
jgi:hypothetical protein